MTKLTLNQAISLALANHYPLEMVPGKTHASYRYHCLINTPGIPELSLVFGDEKNGYLFDSAWVATASEKVRIAESDLMQLLSTPYESVGHWTREMPAATNPERVPAHSANPDLGQVRAAGEVVRFEKEGYVLRSLLPSTFGEEILVKGGEQPALGDNVLVSGKYLLADNSINI